MDEPPQRLGGAEGPSEREAYLPLRSWHGRNHHNFNEHPRPPNRDQPIISQAVVHGNVAYFAASPPTRLSAISKPRLLKYQHAVDCRAWAKKCPRYW
jgi:hypothetical protein